jgi:hypothetical protein
MTEATHSIAKAPLAILRGPFRDLINRAATGTDAPKAQERIWIDPTALDRIYVRNPSQTPDFRRRHSGMVIGGDWDRHTEPLDESWKIAACLARFRDGLRWEDTGIFDHMQHMIDTLGSFDSCQTPDDICARYAEIDILHDDIKANGFRDETILSFGVPRLPEGVFIHIARDGSPIFGAIGNHRMGIARALELARIPAQLGVVHPKALQNNALAAFRRGAR